MKDNLKIAITVDDLPRHGDTVGTYSRYDIAANLVNTFIKHKLPPVTGFVNGYSIDKYSLDAEILNLWVNSGNLVGCHTYRHSDFRKVNREEFIIDIEKNHPILAKYNRHDFKTFRYPYLAEGNTHEKLQTVRHYLQQRNYKIAPVTVDYQDFLWNIPVCKCLANGDNQRLQELKELYVDSAVQTMQWAHEVSRKLFNRDIKHILLIHMGLATSMFFDYVVEKYQQMGWKFIELSQALEDEVYDAEYDVTAYNGLDFLQQQTNIKKINVSAYPTTHHQEVLRVIYDLPSVIEEEKF